MGVLWGVAIWSNGAFSQMVFDTQVHDFGKIKKASKLLSQFVIYNNGAENAYILTINGGAGFTWVTMQKPVRPGESDTLKLYYHPEKPGPFQEKIQVFVSSSQKPVTLTIKGVLEELDKTGDICYSFSESEGANNSQLFTPLTGLVVDKQSQLPITDATVNIYLFNDLRFQSLTKENGEFVYRVMPNLYHVTCRAQGYKSIAIDYHIAPTSGPLRIELEKNPLMDTTIILAQDTGVKSRYVSYTFQDGSPIQWEIDTALVRKLHDEENKQHHTPPTPILDTTPIPDVKENGELNELVFKPNNVVFLIDVSASMKEPDKLPVLKEAIKTMISQLRSIDKVSIIIYGSDVKIIVPSIPANQKDHLYKIIDHLSAGGLTAANQGMKTAYLEAIRNYIPGGNNQVILATDGAFNLLSADKKIITDNQVSQQKILLTVMGFGKSKSDLKKLEDLSVLAHGHFAAIQSNALALNWLLEEIKQNSRRK